MSDWTDGYISELEYTHGVYREMSPAHLRFCLLSKGIRPPEAVEGSFAYCELGFGQGVTLNIAAASNPEGRFYGADFNPSHAAGARALAQSAGTDNLTVYDDSFQQLLEHADLPRFDYISLHGVYSWISPENRAAIVTFITKKLAVGGVVYISYNTLPGWAPVMPLRRLFVEDAAACSGGTAERVEHAMAFAKQIQDLGAGYYKANPSVGPRLEAMGKMSRNYLAHEYFNKHWTPLYHSDVAGELDPAKVTFAASASLADHVDVVNLPGEAVTLLRNTPDPALRETLRDYFMNQQFRRDIFTRGCLKLPGQEQVDMLTRQRFALTVPRASIPQKASFPMGEVEMKPEIYDPILDCLAAGPQTLGEIVNTVGQNTLPVATALQALILLSGKGWTAAALEAKDDRKRRKQTRRFNSHILNQARFSETYGYLASPVLGAGAPVDRFDQLFMLADHTAEDAVKLTWSVLKSQGQRIIKDGKKLDSEADNIDFLTEKRETYEAARKSVYQGLGLL